MRHLKEVEINTIYSFLNDKGLYVDIDLDDFGSITVSAKDKNPIFDGMQILFENGTYEVSQYMAGKKENELHVYTKTKSLKVALKSLSKGSSKRIILEKWTYHLS